MRRTDREITDKTEIEDILDRAYICHLGLCDQGIPYIVPLNYGRDGNCLYMHCARKGKKIDILRVSNIVSFVVYTDERISESDIACKWTMEYRSVMGMGRAVLVETAEEKEEALRFIMKHYSKASSHDFDKSLVDRTVIIRVDIESLTGKKSVR
jgi:nitroimidazol reductase NimA-like FMN-containing flavoprotein (pyridoxamine 5'-phosphate oxidase superfamily)